MTTNSLINNIMGNSAIVPEVGMGATELCWTDRHAYTIIAVSKSGRRITVQRDNAERTDDNGMSESQMYTFTPNPDGGTYIVTLRKNGSWILKGDSLKGARFAIGHRSEYHDFSF